MMKLQCTRFDAAGIPVLSDAEIDKFAHIVLKDYKPALLQEAGKINYAHFIESYLEADLYYYDIFNEDPEKPIWGMTIFEEGEIKVFDRDKLCVKDVWMGARSVVLDNFIMQDGKEGLGRFTGLHEAGHLIMPTLDDADIENLDFYEPPAFVACRRDNIENFASRRRKRTPEEWREHQADCFAGCIAMPTVTFLPFVRQILRDHGIWKPNLTTGRDEDTDYIAEELLPEFISEAYGVSKIAAFIKLVKCGIVIDRKPRKV